MVIEFKKKGFDFKRVMQILLSSAAMALVIFIVIWVLEYFSKEISNVVLTNFKVFLVDNWPIIVGFVFIKLLWDYLHGLYYKNKAIQYTAPLIVSIELIFGFWLVVVFLSGLTALSISEQVNVFLNFAKELFFAQFLVIALLILVVKYAQFFFSESKRNEDED
jgi:hypothetical protein